MARASRLSGDVGEEEREIENLLQERSEHPSELVSSVDNLSAVLSHSASLHFHFPSRKMLHVLVYAIHSNYVMLHFPHC